MAPVSSSSSSDGGNSDSSHPTSNPPPSKKPENPASPLPASIQPPSKKPRTQTRTKSAVVAASPKEEDDVVVAAKPQHFQRVFTEEDEITILKELSNYFAKKETNKSVYEWILEKLEKVNKTQLADKIKKMRRKFRKNESEVPVFKPKSLHQRRIFKLSRKIWGSPKEEKKESVKQQPISKLTFTIGDDGIFDLSLPLGRGLEGNKTEMVSKFSIGDIGISDLSFPLGRGGLKGKTKMDKKLQRKFRIADLKLEQRFNELEKQKIQLLLEAFQSPDE